tara:strand:+ start:71 stop:442 length:372 start_codon:yes stop_codon:yes gene_type:complete
MEKKESLSTSTKKELMVQAMRSSLGNISGATDQVGINRNTHYNWMKDDSQYAQDIKDCLERSIDFAEASLMKNIQDGNTTATIFYLKTKGKKRGYVERQEITGADGAKMFTVKVIKDADELGD